MSEGGNNKALPQGTPEAPEAKSPPEPGSPSGVALPPPDESDDSLPTYVPVRNLATQAPPSAGPLSVVPSPVRNTPLLAQVERENYVVTGPLAQGGIGRILRARDLRLDRPVALKELIKTGGAAEARFLAEALVTARLQHPSIIPVYEAGRWTTGEPFYAMKLVSGRSLAEVLRETATLEQRLALLPHVIAVAEAMAYAHSERIIHRDLKPANVLVGGFGETVVIDWGLAKDLSSVEHPSSDDELTSGPKGEGNLTQAGAVMGTPAYMPPEQAAGHKVDARADVYSLGAILYHLLAGASPYAHGSAEQVLDQVLRAPPVPLDKRQEGIPGELQAIVRKAMAREAAERYPTARELAEDLRRFQTGQLVAAHEYTLSERLRRTVRRHRTLVVSAAAVLLATIGLGAFSIQRIVAEKDRAELKQAEAEAAGREAEAARKEAVGRADELLLLQARAALDQDPNRAVSWLRGLSPSFANWSVVRTLAADAQSRGFATVLSGHTGAVQRVLWTRDGQNVITAGDDGSLRLWHLARREVEVRPAHSSGVSALALSPDGSTLASAGKEGTLALWSLAAWMPRRFPGHAGPVLDLTFSRDGTKVATSGEDGSARLWDPVSGRQLATREGKQRQTDVGELQGELSSLTDVRSAAAKTLTLLSSGKHWTLAPGEQSSCAAFSPRGDVVAMGVMSTRAGQHDYQLRLWDARAQLERTLVSNLPAPPRKLAFSADGGQLAVSLQSSAIMVVDVASGRGRTYPGHEGWASSLSFSRDGKWLASGGYDRTARLWNLESGEARVLRGFQDAIRDVAFSRDSEHLAIASADGTARVVDVVQSSDRVLAGEELVVYGLIASADGHWLAGPSEELKLRVWDTVSGEVSHLPGFQGNRYVFSPKEPLLAFSGTDATLHLWRAGEEQRVLPTRAGPVIALAFSPDGQRLAVATRDGALLLWEAASGELRPLTNAPGLRTLAFSPDGALLALGGGDGAVRLRDVVGGEERLLGSHSLGVTATVFTPDGTRLITSGLDRNLRQWNLDGTDGGWKVGVPGERVRQLLITPDGESLFTLSSQDSNLRQWDARTGKLRAVLKGHEGDVGQIALSPEGTRLASASSDGTVRLWDVKSGESRALRGSRRPPTGVAFLAQGGWLASVEQYGTVRLWRDDLPWEPGPLREWLSQVDAPFRTVAAP